MTNHFKESKRELQMFYIAHLEALSDFTNGTNLSTKYKATISKTGMAGQSLS